MLINEYVAMELNKMREQERQTQYVNRAVTEVIIEYKVQEQIKKRKPR